MSLVFGRVQALIGVCAQVLKQYCEKEDVELPSLPARTFTTGSREDIERMRELLTSCGAKLAPFIQVTGIVAEVNQEFILMTEQIVSVRDVPGPRDTIAGPRCKPLDTGALHLATASFCH